MDALSRHRGLGDGGPARPAVPALPAGRRRPRCRGADRAADELNQAAIEADLALFAPTILDRPQEEITHSLEQLIRSYDPCISCATHFLQLEVEDVP